MPSDTWLALEADLMGAGFVLSDYPDRYGLRTLLAFLRNSQRASAVYRSVHGQRVSDWGNVEELLAIAIETLRDANWQRQGNPMAPRPPRLIRPGQEAKQQGYRHFGGDGMTIAEFEKRMAAARRKAAS